VAIRGQVRGVRAWDTCPESPVAAGSPEYCRKQALPAASLRDAQWHPTWGASGTVVAVTALDVPRLSPFPRVPNFAGLAQPFPTQILPQVEQEARGSPAELVEEGAQAEDQQGSHAETVVPEGEAQERQQRDPALAAAQARRGAPHRGPMGPGIRAAAGMLLLLLLHRRLRRLEQPAPARKRSPIRRQPERLAGCLHMERDALRAAGWGRGGAEVAGLRVLCSSWSPPLAAAPKGPKCPGPRRGGGDRNPRLVARPASSPASRSSPAPQVPPRPGLAPGSPPAPAWTPRALCGSRAVCLVPVQARLAQGREDREADTTLSLHLLDRGFPPSSPLLPSPFSLARDGPLSSLPGPPFPLQPWARRWTRCHITASAGAGREGGGGRGSATRKKVFGCVDFFFFLLHSLQSGLGSCATSDLLGPADFPLVNSRLGGFDYVCLFIWGT
jgi:hypothetical protein